MFKKCYRCGKLFLSFHINEYGRCKHCEETVKEELWHNKIKEEHTKKVDNKPIKPAPNYQPFNAANTSQIQIKPLPKKGMVFYSEKYIESEDIQRLEKRFIAFDVETTGLNSYLDRIIEVGAVLFEDGKPVKTFDSLVNPNVLVPQSATAVNHITDEMVKNAPSEESVFSDLISFFGDALDRGTIICAHNARFDMGFLSETLMRLGYSGKIHYVDTLGFSRKLVCGVENYKQQTLANYFGITNSQDHRAASDAKVCGEILLKLLYMVREEALRKEQLTNSLKNQIEILQNEYKNMQAEISINPINNRVPLSNIHNASNRRKGIDKGFSYWRQGENMRKAGSIEASIKLFDEARYNGYCEPALYESYAMAYRKIKDIDNEIDILNEAIDRFANNVSVCIDFAVRRNKALSFLLKQKEKEQELLIKEQKKQERIAKKEAVQNMSTKPKGRAIIKMNDEMEVIEKYDTVSSAAKENGISPKSIRDVANGVYKHAGGFVWRYADDNSITSQKNE